MGLTKVRLGNLITLIDERNNLGLRDFRGLNKDKSFIETVAKTDTLDETKYKVIRRERFAFSGMQTGRDKCIRISMSEEDDAFLVSPAYTTFEVCDKDILPQYLYMFFCSKEKDRLGWFLSDGSIRANLDWAAFCGIEINLPPIEIQRKYVAIYESMLANQRVYEKGLDDLKLTCDALIEKLMRDFPLEAIGSYIEQSDTRNNIGLRENSVRGLSINKSIIPTKAKLNEVNLSNYKIIQPLSIVYVPVTSRNGDKISIALNEDNETYITSAINTVFYVKDTKSLLPEYLMLFFNRTEFDRYARFNSWGSARETFDWNEMCNVKIPIPDISVQRYVVSLYRSWRTRIAINDKLKSQLKDICPVLIKGSIEEATR